MKRKSQIHRVVQFIGIQLVGLCILSSCGGIYQDLPECKLYVKFKYDYNMLSADAFHSQVDKVELYVFDKDGIFLFQQAEEGAPLATGSYLMTLEIPAGEYKFMAWAGARDSYEITRLTAGVSTIEEMRLKLKRDESLIIDKELEPLWYGEIIDVNFTGQEPQTETINLIKNTNKIRFVLQSSSVNWIINSDDYHYELVESNGYMDYTNALLPDDTLYYRPYFEQQTANNRGVIIELNTMRLMADRSARFAVTEKATGDTVFDINLTDLFTMLRMEQHSYWSEQEYLDREDEYKVVIILTSWLALSVEINGWTWYSQTEMP